MRALHRRPILVLAALALAGPANALYKVVGPDGKITYSDRAPAENGKASQIKGGGGAGDVTAGLPYELRQVAGKFPVTLYTKDNCAPCAEARSHLRQRGVPFSEKTVNTRADIDAFKSTEGTTTIPVVRIGGQQLQGFSGPEWNNYLDAAGYPAKSALPSTYRFPAAQPMVAREALPAADAASKADGDRRGAPADARTPAPATPATTPGGIRF